MPVTIKDVAKIAGVSPSTVSRVIAENPSISRETRVRVHEAMEELGYHPNLVARNLVNRSAQTIGMVMPRAAEDVFLDPFYPEIIRGISAVARRERYDLLLATGETEEEERETVMRMVHGGRVDGVILLVSRVENSLGAYLKAQNFPLALVGKPLQHWDICWVDNDNITAAYMATKHLLSLGHRVIGCMTGDTEFVFNLDRLEGYKKAMTEYGLPFDRSLVATGHSMEPGGYQAMKEMLNRRPDLTAVVTVDDLIAFGAMQAAEECGRRIPEDLSIIGFNNSPKASFSKPPLTTVEIYVYQLGVRVTELLLDKIRNPEESAGNDLVGTELICRESCSPIKGG